MRITKTSVDGLKPPEIGYALHWDEKLPGFGVRVTARGVKTFVLQKRIKGRSRRIKLGRYGAMTVEQARSRAVSLAGEIEGGQDPVARLANERLQAVTLGEALERYLAIRKSLKPRTVADMRKVTEGYFADWLNQPVVVITRDRVARRHTVIGSRSPAQANLAMRYLRAIINFAAVEYTRVDGSPILTDNPVKRLSQTRAWYRVERRQTVIKPHQLRPWLQAVLGLANTTARDYFLLLLLTGLRREEGRQLRFDDLDLEGRTLTVRDPKNRLDHVLPLSDYLLELLEQRSLYAAGEQVFATSRGLLSNLRYAQNTVIEASGVAFCPNDLRRTFITAAESLDIPAYALKRLINHKTNDVTGGYIVMDTERLRKPMQRITDYLLGLGGLREGAAVVPFESAGL